MNKSRRNIAIIVGSIALVGIIVIGVLGVYHVFVKEDNLEEAFENTFQEMDQTSLNDIFGNDELLKTMQEQGADVSFEMQVDEAFGEPVSGAPTIHVETMYDPDKQVLNFAADGKYAGFAMEPINLYMDQQYVILDAPILYKQPFQIDYTGDLGEKIKNAPFMQLSGLSDENVNHVAALVNILMQSIQNNKTYHEEFMDQLVEIRHLFFENMEMKKIDAVQMELDDKKVNCKGYSIYLTTSEIKDLCYQFMEARNTYYEKFFTDDVLKLADEMKIDIASYMIDDTELLQEIEENIQDATIEAYLYKNQIAKMNCTIVLADQRDLTITYQTQGGKHLFENMSCSVISTENGETYTVSLTRTTQDTEQAYQTEVICKRQSGTVANLIFSYDKENQKYQLGYSDIDEQKISCKGTVQDITIGNTLAFSIDECVISKFGENEFIVSGNASINGLTETIHKPEGETLDILQMTEEEWMNVFYSVYGKIYGFSSQLN